MAPATALQSAVLGSLPEGVALGAVYALAVGLFLAAGVLWSGGPDRRRPAGAAALGAVAVGVAFLLDGGSPNGIALADPAMAVVGAVLTGVGIVTLGALALGWHPGTGRTAWPAVGGAAVGLLAVPYALDRAGIADELFLPVVLLATVALAAAVGASRGTLADAARHGSLAAGLAAVALLVPLGHALTVARSGVPLTGAVAIAGFLLPLAACLAGAAGGALGGAVASRRGSRPSRA